MNKSESIKELASALCKAQSTMSGALKSSNNPFFKSKYSDITEVLKVMKEPLAENGLSFMQFPINGDNGTCGVRTIVMHSSGEFLEHEYLMPVSKQDPQGYGGCITYSRRYALVSIFGIPQEDDDANYSSKKTATKKPEMKATGKPISMKSFEKICICGQPIQGQYSVCYKCSKKKQVDSYGNDPNFDFGDNVMPGGKNDLG